MNKMTTTGNLANLKLHLADDLAMGMATTKVVGAGLSRASQVDLAGIAGMLDDVITHADWLGRETALYGGGSLDELTEAVRALLSAIGDQMAARDQRIEEGAEANDDRDDMERIVPLAR